MSADDASSGGWWDENAALQWAVEQFRRETDDRLRAHDSAGEGLAYNRRLLRDMKSTVRTIQHYGARAIVVPDSYETEHRIDRDELLDLVREAREGEETTSRYLLAIAGALVDNGDSLPDPLKEFATDFLHNPREPSPKRGRKSGFVERDRAIGFVVATICIRGEFSPTRNEVTDKASAISITQRALKKVGIDLTEAAITKIWDKSIFKHCWK